MREHLCEIFLNNCAMIVKNLKSYNIIIDTVIANNHWKIYKYD